MREAFIQVFTQILFDLLLLALSVGFAYISKQLARSQKMEHVAHAMEELEKVVVNIVGELQQTTVEKMKEATEDGKLTKTDIEWLGKQLVNKAAAQISAPAADVLAAVGIDTEAMIHSIAEAYIAQIKRGA